MDLPGRVLATVRAYRMVRPGGRVLVAVSGGADSLGLLHLLLAIADTAPLTVVGVVHLNHGLRAAADHDEAFCRAAVAASGLPFVTERQDVGALARSWRTSIEDAGRRARYDFFRRAAATLEADTVATGHTRDDQAETYLLQLMRGAGPRGLAGVRPVAGQVCRPLLDVGRAEIRDWLTGRGVQFVEDESNTDPAFLRNRLRADLMPLLAERFSAGIVNVLARSAAIAREDAEFLEAEAARAAASLVLVTDAAGRTLPVAQVAQAVEPITRVEVDAAGLAGLPRALGARVARLAMAPLADGRYLSAEHSDRLLALAERAAGGLSLPGQEARVAGGRIALRRRPPRAFANSFRHLLSIPGEVSLTELGWAVSADWPDQTSRPVSAGSDPAMPDLSAPILSGSLDLPLAVRTRRRGDRFEPPGMAGRSRKLQDYFVDRRIDREARDLVPLVVDRNDRIVWVVGQGVAEPFRVSGPAQGVLLLKARRLGGPG